MGTEKGSRAGLSNLDLAYVFDMALAAPEEGIVARQMSPLWRTGGVTHGKITISDYEDGATVDVSDHRPERGPAQEIDRGDTSVRWKTEPKAFKITRDKKTLSRNPNRPAIISDYYNTIAMQLMRKEEARIQAAADAAIVITSNTATPSVKWDDTATTVRADIWTVLRTVRLATYSRGKLDAMAIPLTVLEYLSNNAEIAALATPPAYDRDNLTPMMVAAWMQSHFGFRRVAVADSPNWSETVYFYRLGVDAGEVVNPETYPGTFVTPMADEEMEMWELETSQHEIEFGVEWEVDAKVLHPESLYSLTNVLT